MVKVGRVVIRRFGFDERVIGGHHVDSRKGCGF